MALNSSFLWNIETQLLYEIAGELKFGRSADAGIYIANSAASRLHFSLEIEGEEIYITDLNSSNGTKVNGLDLVANEKIKLQHADFISVGTALFIIFSGKVIDSLDKEKLERDLPFIATAQMKEQALKKSVIFFKLNLPEKINYSTIKNNEKEKELILEKRSKDLEKVDQQKALVDEMYQKNLALINQKYQQVEKNRDDVMAKYASPLGQLDNIIDDFSQKLSERKSQHYFSIDESSLTHNREASSETSVGLELAKKK